MPEEDTKSGRGEVNSQSVLRGTTLRVYQLIFKEGKPMRTHEVQRALRLSSPSVAQYHIAKLIEAGLIRESENGYLADKVVFGNLVRVKRMVIPLQITYVVFFAASLIVLLTVSLSQY